MNILETYTPHTADAMNLLQERGIISDLCVTGQLAALALAAKLPA